MATAPDRDELFRRRQQLQLMGLPEAADPRGKTEYWANICIVEPVLDAKNGDVYQFPPRPINGAIPIAESANGATARFFPWDDVYIALKIHPDATFFNGTRNGQHSPALRGAKQAYRNVVPDPQNPNRSATTPDFMFGTHAATHQNGFTPQYTEAVHDGYVQALGCLRHKSFTSTEKPPYVIDFIGIDHDLIALFNALATLLSFNRTQEPIEMQNKFRIVNKPIIREIIGERATNHLRELTAEECRLSTADYVGLDPEKAAPALRKYVADRPLLYDGKDISEIFLATRPIVTASLERVKDLPLVPDKQKEITKHVFMTTQIIRPLLHFHAITHPRNSYLRLLGFDPETSKSQTRTGENLYAAHQAVSGMLNYFGYKRYQPPSEKHSRRVSEYLKLWENLEEVIQNTQI